MSIKMIKAFGRAAAEMKPSARRKMFEKSLHDRIDRDSFNEGLIEGLDSQKAIAKGLPAETAAGHLTWRGLGNDLNRAVTRAAERRFQKDYSLNPLRMGKDSYFDTWKSMMEKYRQDIVNDLRNKSISIQDIFDPYNNQWFDR
jgi:hypothetical protein